MPFSLTDDKIEPEVVENMRIWQHSGQSVDQSVLAAALDHPPVTTVLRN